MIRILRNEPVVVTLYEDEYSKRVRMDDYEGPLDAVIRTVESALPKWTEKLIIKSRPIDVEFFQSKGLREEAFIPNYFNGADMHFMTKYLSQERSQSIREADEEAILRAVLLLPPSAPTASAAIKFAGLDDAEDLARLYRETFRVYPTPVGDPKHIHKTMEEGTVYVLIREQNKVVSAASAEINTTYKNAELTDCATAEGYEGKGYMRALLIALEENLKARNITCLYTIARSASFGMNKVFHQLGYKFGGRMTKNCMIYSGMEDMNVWSKAI